MSTTPIQAVRSFRLVQAGSLVFLAVMACYLGVSHPRPYFVTEIDLEHDYLYNAKLVHQGRPIAGIHHPGTPVYHLGALLLRLTGDEPAHTQRFFDAGYACILVANAAAILFFAGTVLRQCPLGVSILSVSTVFAWPPFLLYTNHFGADSFVPAAGLTLLALLWRALRTDAPLGARALFLCGLSGGLCLAIKTSFLPVVFAAAAAGVAHVWTGRRARGLHPMAWTAAAMPGGILLGYLVCTATILKRLPLVWSRSLDRADTRPPGGVLTSLAHSARLVWGFNPLLLVLGMGAIAAFAFVWIAAWRRGTLSTDVASSAGGGFDGKSAGLFVLLATAGWLYTLAAAAGDWGPSAESRLRNVTPSAIVLPFAVACAWRLAAAADLQAWTGRAARATLGVAGAGLLAWSVARHVTNREVMLREHIARQQAVRASLELAARGPGRIAFWTRYLDHLGEASFHFWGNYRYAYSVFDDALLRAYPCCTLLRLRDIGAAASTASQTSARRQSRYGKLGDMAWAFRKWLTQAPDPYAHVRQTFAGAAELGSVSLAAFPMTEYKELAGAGDPGLRAALEAKWPAVEESKERVAGEDWELLRPATVAGAVH